MTAFAGLDPKEWWRLATIAERRGIKVQELLVEQSRVEPTPVSRLQQLSDEVSAARRAGHRVPRRQTTPSQDRDWAETHRRRENLESFRHMGTDWADHVQKIVDEAPPLTERQRSTLRTLLSSGSTAPQSSSLLRPSDVTNGALNE